MMKLTLKKIHLNIFKNKNLLNYNISISNLKLLMDDDEHKKYASCVGNSTNKLVNRVFVEQQREHKNQKLMPKVSSV